VPTKALLTDSLMIAAVRQCYFMKGDMQVSLKRMQNRKFELVNNSQAGIGDVLIERGVRIIDGSAAFTSPTTMTVTKSDGQDEITATYIIIATGSKADYGPNLTANGLQVLNTDDALNLNEIPRSLAVVGAGNRGVEFASLYNNLGTQVVLIEKEKQLLPRIHWDIANRYRKALLDRNIKVLTGTTLLTTRCDDNKDVILTLEGKTGVNEIRTDKVLLTGTRQPDYANLNLEAAGLTTHDGHLVYGLGMETSQENIYVVGDAAGPPYFAHKAIAQGITAVDHIRGKDINDRTMLIPNCIYGDPEVASIGVTEVEALAIGRKVKLGEFYFIGNGRAGTIGKEEGMVLIVSDTETAEVLGVHMIGPGVTELVSVASLAMRNGIDVDGIKNTIFPHPALAETLFEAALASDDEAIHMQIGSEELEPD
jgi:dihydrolipoamide dehydrogenase